MSSSSSDKQAKGKSRKGSTSKSHKLTKGAKEANANVDKFRGDGVNFKCKLLGVAEVDGPRGDNMCIEAIKKLKLHQRQSGEHKMKIILNVTLMGIKILEDKTKNVMFEHPVNKVSFITHDPEDKKIFSFISSAKCSAGSVGHMMYAIKYDKVAGIVTSTLYDLFQAVFKLRQEAALKQRNAKREPQPPPQNSHSPASNAVLSNGPSEASNANDNNIYEEPSTASTVVKEDDEPTHYQVPIARPLPPAPYTSQSSQGNPPSKENSGDSTSNQVTVLSSSDFFSSSVFSQADHADNVSEASVDMTRKGSISSSISSTSETASFDRSLELKTVAASSTPPAIPKARNVASNSSAILAGHSLELKPTPEDEDPDYETIASSDYEIIPTDLVSKPEKNVTKEFGEFSFKESFADDQAFPFEAEKKTNDNVDPFASEPSLKKSDGSPPSSAVFGNDDFFSSHFDDKDASAHAPTTDFPVDDPFAPTFTPTSSSAPKEAQSNDPFASSDAFETAFGAGETSSATFGSNENHDQTEEKSKEPPKNDPFASGDAFESAFGSSEMSPLPFEPNKSHDQTEQESKEPPKSEVFVSSEAFNADFDTPVMFPPVSKPITANENEQGSSKEELQKDLSWGEVFGKNEQEEPSDINKDPSWAAAFEDSQMHNNDDQPTKSDKKEVSFSFDDSFGAKFDGEELDRGQQPDNVAAEPDFSWTNAFNEKSQKEVTFSWDGAFGGQKDNEDGQTNSDFKAVDFNNAFSSTPFKPTQDKSTIKTNGAFPLANFGDVLSPLKPDKPSEKIEDESTSEGKSVKEEGGSETRQSSEAKPMLANMEDLFNENMIKDNKEICITSQDDSKTVVRNTIPQIIEPPKEESSDAEDDPARRMSIVPNKRTDSLESSAPPPLPPRPIMAPLPSLPPRPRTHSSPVVGQIPPTPPRPVGSTASPASKSGTSKRAPPALPPRIDLEDGKTRANSASVGTTSAATSDPFIITGVSENKNSWQASWPDEPKHASKENDSNSKKSPDPFEDNFFTDFNFSATAKNAGNTSDSVNQNNTQLFSDPFVAKEGTDDMFKADFGGVDPFADFTSNNKTVDPFASDGGDVFSGFSTSNDPFLDSVDPFAEKGTLNDPFVSPKKDGKEGNISLQLNENSDDGDFADSFA